MDLTLEGFDVEGTTHSLFLGGEQQKRTFPFIDHQSRGQIALTVNAADHRLYNKTPRMSCGEARYRYRHDNREADIKPYIHSNAPPECFHAKKDL